MPKNNDERRHFKRIPFHVHAHLNSEKGDMHVNCDVLDISLNGILVAKPEGWVGENNDKFQIDIILENAQLVIKMITSVAHIDQCSIGFICEYIDVDSMTHLKRLVELNLGDSEILNREFLALIH